MVSFSQPRDVNDRKTKVILWHFLLFPRQRTGVLQNTHNWPFRWSRGRYTGALNRCGYNHRSVVSKFSMEDCINRAYVFWCVLIVLLFLPTCTCSHVLLNDLAMFCWIKKIRTKDCERCLFGFSDGFKVKQRLFIWNGRVYPFSSHNRCSGLNLWTVRL